MTAPDVNGDDSATELFVYAIPVDGACPDCIADVILELLDPGITAVTVLHDATCPWLARRTAS